MSKTLFYFGADLPWSKLKEVGFYRRNTWILKEFIKSNFFDKIYVIHYTPLKNLFKKISSKENGIDIYYTNFFPKKILDYSFIKQINSVLIKLLLNIQSVNTSKSQKNIIWAYWPKGFIGANQVNLNGRYFFDTDHNIINDINLSQDQKQIQEKILLDAAQKCELVISSSRSMLNWFNKQGYHNVYRIRNGICLSRFNTKKNTINVPKPIIGYVGSLSKWINYELFENLIKNNPQWNFVIYGKAFKTENTEKLIKYSNVYLKGFLSYDKLPETIRSFDVALNLYKNYEWLDVDSMKLFEYLAAGIPVVSTNFHQYLKEDFNNILHIGDTFEEIQKQIELCLNIKREINNEAFLINNTWETRIKEIIQIFKKKNEV